MKLISQRWFIAASVVLCSCATAFSAQQMQTMDFGPTTPNFTAGPFDFDQFDPALGTLNFVKFKLQIDVEGGTLTVDNDGVEGGTLVGVEIGAEGSLVSVGSNPVTLLDSSFGAIAGSVVASTSQDFTLAGNTGDGAMDFDGSAPDGGVLSGLAQTTMDMGELNTQFWPQVTGTSTFPLSAEVDQVNNFGTGIGGVEGAFTAVTASGNIMVVYDYEPVPEPSALTLLGLAIIGCVRRFR